MTNETTDKSWYAGSVLECEGAIREEIAKNVEAACIGALKFGEFCIGANNGTPEVMFSYGDLPAKAKLSIVDLEYFGHDEHKDAVIAALQCLIEKIRLSE